MIKRIARGAIAMSFCSTILISGAPGAFAQSADAHTNKDNVHHQSSSANTQAKHQAGAKNTPHQNKPANQSTYQAQPGKPQANKSYGDGTKANYQYAASSTPAAQPKGHSSQPTATFAVAHPAITKNSSAIPGNNGTVKIHATAGDTSHHNQPHVGCNFFVDYFNYDVNDNLSTTFAAHAPSGSGQLGSADVFTITSFGNKGFNTERPYDLSSYLSGLRYNAQQGYHVKLSVANQSAPGGSKHKVFWVNCQQPTAPGQGGGGGTTPPTTTPPTTTPPTTTTTGGGRGGGVVLASSTTTSSEPQNTTSSSGNQIASLPYTGSREAPSIWVAIISLLGLATAAYWRRAVSPLLKR